VKPSIQFSIIIPVYNDWDRLKLCLEALSKQNINSLEFEIIIVNNNPEDTCPYDLSFPNTILINEPKPGSYIARNAGIEFANGEIIAFTDSDCIPKPNWLENALEIFQNKDIHLIGGKVELFKEYDGSDMAYIYEKNYAFKQHINVPKGNGVTANLFVRKKVLNDLGGFDANMKSGGDWAFTQKCVKAGYNFIYSDLVSVLHPARKSVKQILKKQKRLVSWGIINNYYIKNYHPIRILGSIMYNEVKFLLNFKKYPKKPYDFLSIFIINLLRFKIRTFYAFLITSGIADPQKIRS
jgi:glycosyltransferase involved in cell wall biosynthesis